MRFKGLDLNLLVALDALLTHQNVTVAARHVAMSQSAMSGALARLRRHFEDELLVKVHRRMVLTPLACNLAKSLEMILADTGKLLSTRSGFDPGAANRRFSICCSDYVWMILISNVLGAAAIQAPWVQIHYAGPSSEFSKGDADLLIAPEDFRLESHPSAHLFQDDYVCLVWSENTLLKDSITDRQLVEVGHVVALSQRRTFIHEWFTRRYGDAMRIAVVVPSFTLLPLSVVGTNHLAVVPRRLALQSVGHLPVRIVASSIEIPDMIDVIQWRAEQDKDHGLLWLRTLIMETARRLFDGPPLL